ncbi:MAG: hypothetical protein ABI091_30565 [Ferruginibacter sp.]
MLFIFSCKVQGQDKFNFYDSKGERIYGDSLSINDIVRLHFDSLTRYRYVSSSDDDLKKLSADFGIMAVGFQIFTNKPYFVLADRDLTPSVVQLVFKNFTKAQYLSSKSFYDDIKKFTAENVLSKSFIIETLGKPDEMYQNEENKEQWQFSNYKLTFLFEDSMAVGFLSENYKNNIERRYDKVSDIKRFSIPATSFYDLTKVNNKGKIHYFIEMYSSSSINTDSSPVILLLANGRRIIENVSALDYGIDDIHNHKTYAHLYLNESQAALLAASPIDMYKLGDAEEVMPTEIGKELQNYFKILLPLK